MTREEAHTFLDNLKVCIEEHPIVADWLVEIADRKTEPQTCDTCKFADKEWYEEPCEDCHGNSGYDRKDEPTISKMEQVEDEPQTDCAWKKGE